MNECPIWEYKSLNCKTPTHISKKNAIQSNYLAKTSKDDVKTFFLKPAKSTREESVSVQTLQSESFPDCERNTREISQKSTKETAQFTLNHEKTVSQVCAQKPEDETRKEQANISPRCLKVGSQGQSRNSEDMSA